MKLSVYTYVKNGLFLDFHVVAMLKHHLALADEIVVNEGFSDDGTYEAIRDIDPKIKVYRSRWDDVPPGRSWWGCLSDDARQRCTGDWCVKLDTDEFIPEWEFDRIRKLLTSAQKDLFPLRFKNFYANYKVLLHAEPGLWKWPEWKIAVHRNLPTVHAVGDGSSVRINEEPWDEVPSDAVEVHHFG